jgi:hypothetical protein
LISRQLHFSEIVQTFSFSRNYHTLSDLAKITQTVEIFATIANFRNAKHIYFQLAHILCENFRNSKYYHENLPSCHQNNFAKWFLCFTCINKFCLFVAILRKSQQKFFQPWYFNELRGAEVACLCPINLLKNIGSVH